jgi:hypothetical protein
MMKHQPLQRRRMGLALLLMLAATTSFILVPLPAYAQDAKTTPPKSATTSPTFSEADAVRVLSDLRQALESGNPRRFLKLFDARKMPGFAAFRDQITEFFEKYSPIRMNYRVTQVTTEGDFGSAAVEIALEGSANQSGASNLRTTVPIRAIFGWDGRTWRIVDWSPREMFR